MSNKVEKFLNDNFGEVGAIKDDKGVIWFVASDISKVLGYRMASDMTRVLDEDEKDKFVIETNGGLQNILCVNKKGLHHLLSSNRILDFNFKNEFYKFLTGNVFDSIITKEVKEAKFLNMLEDALKTFGLIGYRQFKVLGKYRLDFYIPSLDIAIEFDENNHRGYGMEAHEFRQKEIEDELDIEFIRVSDKSSNAYNIGFVISKIINKLAPIYVKEAVNQYMELE